MQQRRSTPGSPLALLAGLLLQLDGPGPTRLELAAIMPSGDPISIAPAHDERSVFVVEGCTLIQLDVTGEPGEELARGVIDAAVLDMLHDGCWLWIAGGTQGLFRARAEGTELHVEAVGPRSREGSVCSAVARDPDRVVACHAALGTSELRVHAAETGELLARIPVPVGRPLAVALHDGVAYLALEEAGLARVDLRAAEPRVELGPELAGIDGCYVRDVACAGGRLFAAADGAGLLELDLAAPFWPDARVRQHRLLPAGEIGYAVRVAARGGRVAVGVLRGSAREADGAPYGSFGIIGPLAEVGALPAGAFPQGSREALVLLERREGDLAISATIPLAPCGWRSLALGAERVYEQHLRLGALVRDLGTDPPRVVLRRRPLGLPATTGAASTLDPGRLYFGTDSTGSIARGVARETAAGGLELDPATLGVRSPGLHVGSLWQDPDARAEWFLGGRGFRPSLLRASADDAALLERWPLPLPADSEGRSGHTYFFSHRAGDLLLVTRAGSRHGIVGWSVADLCAEARSRPPGTPLATEHRFTLRTHDPDSRLLSVTGRLQTASLPDGRHLLAVAAGAHAAGDGIAARMLLFELAGNELPRLLAVLSGPAPGGLAFALALGWVGGRLLAFGGDLAGNLIGFDVTDPAAILPLEPWRTGAAPFDGHHDPILDLALDARTRELFAATGRGGIVHLEIGAAPELRLERVDTLDTPGWTVGLVLDERRLVAGDQKAGLRLYRRLPAPRSAPVESR